MAGQAEVPDGQHSNLVVEYGMYKVGVSAALLREKNLTDLIHVRYQANDDQVNICILRRVG